MKIYFTRHSIERMKKRGLTKLEITESIKQPNTTKKKHNKYYFQKKSKRGILEIVCEITETDIKVITVLWR